MLSICGRLWEVIILGQNSGFNWILDCIFSYDLALVRIQLVTKVTAGFQSTMTLMYH